MDYLGKPSLSPTSGSDPECLQINMGNHLKPRFCAKGEPARTHRPAVLLLRAPSWIRRALGRWQTLASSLPRLHGWGRVHLCSAAPSAPGASSASRAEGDLNISEPCPWVLKQQLHRVFPMWWVWELLGKMNNLNLPEPGAVVLGIEAAGALGRSKFLFCFFPGRL